MISNDTNKFPLRLCFIRIVESGRRRCLCAAIRNTPKNTALILPQISKQRKNICIYIGQNLFVLDKVVLIKAVPSGIGITAAESRVVLPAAMQQSVESRLRMPHIRKTIKIILSFNGGLPIMQPQVKQFLDAFPTGKYPRQPRAATNHSCAINIVISLLLAPPMSNPQYKMHEVNIAFQGE